MSAIKVAMGESKRSGRRKTPDAMSAEVSPDSKCPICLDIFHNVSYLDICLHKFCFRCIQEWSKNKAECPLCKQPFNSIYHSIKSEKDYQKYDLKPVNNGSFGSFGGVRFRYRTTLTGVRRQMRGRTSPPPDNGVMFEAQTAPSQQLQDRYVHQMMRRLAARRRASREGRALNNIREQEMINFRRELYRQGVRVRVVRDGGRSRDTSAEFYRRNPACLHRLVPWLKRELSVLYGSHGSLVNIVQHIIMSRITQCDMEDGAILDELRPFIQGRTEHFLHEFINFAKSPFNMESYDQHAVYDCPAPSSNEGSSSVSSVIAISEDEDHVLDLDPPDESMSTPGHSGWDDETPGTSYSTTAEQSRAERVSVSDSDSESSIGEETERSDPCSPQMQPRNQTEMTQGEIDEEGLSSDNDDCVIVGFVKPTVDRTPELVQLTSDSEVEFDCEDPNEVPRLPQHIRFSSLSPPASETSAPLGAGQTENAETADQRQVDSTERRGSPLSGKHKMSSQSDRRERHDKGREKCWERSWSKDRDRRRRRKRRKSSSREHRRGSTSPTSISTLSRGREHCHYSDRGSKYDSQRRDGYQSYQSHRCYSQDRNDSGQLYVESRSYYYSSHKYIDRRSYTRSRSRSRDARRRDRRHSSSLSRSCSPSAKHKPGGKRKYKSRHLEDRSRNALPSSYREGGDTSASPTKRKKRSKDKHRKKSKDKSRRRSRSMSVEFVDEDNSCERRRRHHKKKKKHKKKSKRHKRDKCTEKRSPNIITIDSDNDSAANGRVSQEGSNNKDDINDGTTPDPADTAPPASTS